ncbi:MAG: Trm112 family protein [Duodenibacillus sp.]
MDSRLTEVLVCPICKGPLHLSRSHDKLELHCAKCAKGYAVEGDIPVMLEKEARDLTAEEVEAARIRPAA